MFNFIAYILIWNPSTIYYISHLYNFYRGISDNNDSQKKKRKASLLKVVSLLKGIVGENSFSSAGNRKKQMQENMEFQVTFHRKMLEPNSQWRHTPLATNSALPNEGIHLLGPILHLLRLIPDGILRLNSPKANDKFCVFGIKLNVHIF